MFKTTATAFVLATSLFAGTAYAADFDGSCASPVGAANVTVDVLPMAPVQPEQVSREEMLRRTGRPMNSETSGLAYVEAQTKMNFGLQVVTSKDPKSGSVCGRPNVRAVLGYSAFRVSMLDSLRVGTCRYNTAVSQYQKTVAYYTDALPREQDELRSKIIAALANKVFVGKTEDEVTAEATDAVKTAATKAYKEVTDEVYKSVPNDGPVECDAKPHFASTYDLGRSD